MPSPSPPRTVCRRHSYPMPGQLNISIGPDPPTVTDTIKEWSYTNQVRFSPLKCNWSTYSSSTPSRNLIHTIQLRFLSHLLPYTANPRILGVIFDPLLTFLPHIKSIVSRTQSKINLVSTLAY